MTGLIEEGAAAAVARGEAGAPSAAPRQSGRVPDFFVVGHPKSGTSALYEMLRAHQDVFMPDLKEPVFLAEELPRTAHRAVLPQTLEEYLALFALAGPEQRVGEASATYLWSASAAGRIAALAPQARIVAILREPAAFLRSLHLQNLQSHYEREQDLRRALMLEDARRAGRQLPRGCLRPQALLYSEYVRYVEQLRRYHAVFAREQVLVLIYDDFRADNVATVERVLDFIGVSEPAPAPVVTREVNPTVRVRSQRLEELVHTLAFGRGHGGRAVKGMAKTLLPPGLRRGALTAAQGRLVVSPPPLDERLMAELRARFAPEVVALGEYLGRDLVSLWGYDSLA